jgi:hypothetical protein
VLTGTLYSADKASNYAAETLFIDGWMLEETLFGFFPFENVDSPHPSGRQTKTIA